MTRLLEDTPAAPVEALAAEPLSVAEIDAHPDSARIWATILAMREEHERLIDEFDDSPRFCPDCGEPT